MLNYAELQPGDIELLSEISDVRLAVELGTFMGGSAELLSQKARRVITIDLFEDVSALNDPHYNELQNKSPHSHASICQALSGFKNITIIKDFTYNVPSFIIAGSVDLLFIDADHSYEGVKKDYSAWLPYVAVGGKIAFHDYNSARWPDVTQFIEQEIKADPWVKFYKSNAVTYVVERVQE